MSIETNSAKDVTAQIEENTADKTTEAAHTYLLRCPDCGARRLVPRANKDKAHSAAHSLSDCDRCNRLMGCSYVGVREVSKEKVRTNREQEKERKEFIKQSWGQ